MKIEFAPINIPLRRRIQTVAVLQWLFTFLFFAQCCLAIFVFLTFAGYWYIAVVYTAWLYIDWETPNQGGRRSEWVRNWTIWSYFRDYFPIHLKKTTDLDPQYNYLFGFHPHGVLVAGAFGNFGSDATGFRKLFPGLTSYLCILPFWFKIPFYRDYIMCAGLVSAVKSSASYILSRKGGGNVAVLVIGGAEESLDARPGGLTLRTRKRKGFIKLAIKWHIWSQSFLLGKMNSLISKTILKGRFFGQCRSDYRRSWGLQCRCFMPGGSSSTVLGCYHTGNLFTL
uniref:2-acylglycerol O-acyltransferase 1-like isoform X2 n=1 Tax=Pristiophorus japonicus TaxID=55135 RepID=UPI00398E35F5